MNPEENTIRDETTFEPVENSGEGDEMRVSITRNIEKSIVDTITIGEARNQLDFKNRELQTLDDQKETYLANYDVERAALMKEVEKFTNIINSVN